MSATLIGWIITIVFLIIIAGGFSIGYWRGLKKSSVNLAVSLIGIIIAFFLTPAITKPILNIKVSMSGDSVALRDVAVKMFRKNQDLNSLLNKNPNLEVLVQNLPSALFNALIFILVTLIVEILAYIAYKIIGVVCFKEEQGGRLLGGVIGAVKTFLIAIIAFMPLAGLIGLANNMTYGNDYGVTTAVEADYIKTDGLAKDKLPKNVVNVIGGLENNMLIKCSSVFGLDNAMFDYYSSVKIDDKKVKIREEVENVYGLVDFGYQLSRQDLDKIDYTKIDYDKLSDTAKAFTQSPLFDKVLGNLLADLIINYKDYSFLASSSLSDLLDELGTNLSAEENKAQYFRNDILNLVAGAKEMGKGGLINDILSTKSQGTKVVLTTLTSDDNIASFESGVKRVLSLNIVQDTSASLVNKLIGSLSTELDKAGANSSQFTQKDWDKISKELTSIAKDFSEISNAVDISKVTQDATVLLDKTQNYDIDAITGKLGDMFDLMRECKLLKTEAGTPIIDKLLNQNNFILPYGVVYDGEEEKTIATYKEYFAFVSPSLIKLRDEGIYDLYSSETTTKTLVVSLANILSGENKNDLLSEIILPLYQVEPTRTLIVDKLSSSLGNAFVDLSTLTSYGDYKTDLGYLSDLFISLNAISINDTTMLDKALDGDFTSIIKNIGETDIDKIVPPLLQAKSTNALKDNLFAALKVELDNLTGESVTLTQTGVSFDGEESQTQEITQILKSFVSVNNSENAATSLTNVDKPTLATLLENMKANAYRTQSGKTEEGIFKSSFTALVGKFKLDYNEVITQIENDPALMAELGVENFNEENYGNINYASLMNTIETLLSPGE